jgi:hypothetical protein
VIEKLSQEFPADGVVTRKKAPLIMEKEEGGYVIQ